MYIHIFSKYTNILNIHKYYVCICVCGGVYNSYIFQVEKQATNQNTLKH